MEFIRTEIPDVIICKPKLFNDERGYFYESFKKEALEGFLQKSIDFCQDNESKSTKGVLRGLHYQLPPFAQTKLVRVVKGRVLDVVVDIRKSSVTFGKHIAIELNDVNKYQLLIPKGFAHGFHVLSEEAIFSYKVDAHYNKASERVISFKDSELDIDWKINSSTIISEKDQVESSFLNADLFL